VDGPWSKWLATIWLLPYEGFLLHSIIYLITSFGLLHSEYVTLKAWHSLSFDAYVVVYWIPFFCVLFEHQILKKDIVLVWLFGTICLFPHA
jgi:hypothetical protein